MSFEQTVDICPNAILTVQRNMFIVEVCSNQNFKFVFLESELMTLIAIVLHRAGVIPPLTQVTSAKIPLIEVLVRVTKFFKNFFLFTLGTRVKRSG